MDALALALSALDADGRRRWAVCVAQRAIERLPADHSRRHLLQMTLDNCFPLAGPPPAPRFLADSARLLEHRLIASEVGSPGYQATYLLSLVLSALDAAPGALLAAQMVGVVALGLAVQLGGEPVGRAEAAWQLQRAADYRPGIDGTKLLRDCTRAEVAAVLEATGWQVAPGALDSFPVERPESEGR